MPHRIVHLRVLDTFVQTSSGMIVGYAQAILLFDIMKIAKCDFDINFDHVRYLTPSCALTVAVMLGPIGLKSPRSTRAQVPTTAAATERYGLTARGSRSTRAGSAGTAT